LAVKVLAGRHFDVFTIGIALVAMDIEPLVGIMRGSDILHGPSYTYGAAVIIAWIVALASPPICRPILRRWNQELSFHHMGWLVGPESFLPVPAIVGALTGTVPHVALDSIMHADTTPLAPWSNANGLLGPVSISVLELWCVTTGLVGVVGWVVVGW
jgi:hypothetical protein